MRDAQHRKLTPAARRRAILLAAAFVCVAARAPRSPASAAPAAAPAPAARPAAPARYEPASICARCHAAIHKAWTDSPHARSATSPAYLEAVRRAAEVAPDGAAVRRGCAWCHAPTTLLTGDHLLKQPISNEGVTCDFCHTVTDVDLAKPGHPFTLEPGPIKRGPFEYTRPAGHRSAYSPLHKTSPLLCASCHEYRNAQGVAVLSTYGDWKEGPYPFLGVPCQDCHMALVPGTVAVGGGTAPGSLRVINLHRLVGGSARGQLARGLDLAIESMTRSGSTAEVSVTVSNVAAGHPVPGGLSTKSLILAVEVETADGRMEHRQERIYRRELKDASGRVIDQVADLFLKAASVGSDNRIKPKEVRRERFSLPVPQGAKAIVARLEYRDASDPSGPPKILSIIEARRDLTGR
jgi:hypothetical protein